MQQHPVPQPITSYEFRLVGDMTLKQFAKLAVGVILALIVYGVNPPFLIKWFLILLFGGTGALAAFFPFQGRPIDVWIIAFFKRIYSPTQYIWRQKSVKANLGSVKSLPVETKRPPVQTIFKASTKPKTKNELLPETPQKTSPVARGVETELKAPQQTSTIKKTPPPTPLQKTNPPAVEAKFAPNIAIPIKPTIPNLLTGFVRNPQGKIIEGAILEIRDSGGIPVRAFKTNKLGQFLSATPLPSGSYEIETEKEGFNFDIIKIELKGEILSPIEIVSK